MITEKHTLKYNIYLAAAPRPDYQITPESPNPYAIHAQCFDSASVCPDEVSLGDPIECEIEVPGGIDLVTGLVEKLESSLARMEADHYVAEQAIKDKISNLLCLEAPKQEEVYACPNCMNAGCVECDPVACDECGYNECQCNFTPEQRKEADEAQGLFEDAEIDDLKEAQDLPPLTDDPDYCWP